MCKNIMALGTTMVPQMNLDYISVVFHRISFAFNDYLFGLLCWVDFSVPKQGFFYRNNSC